MKALRIAIVGCGDICNKTYAHNIVDHFHNLEIAAFCDLETARAQALVDRLGVGRVASLNEILSSPDIDIVLNTTNPQVHHPINMAALRAGKHVYSEKPLGLDLAEARQQRDFARENGLYLGCAPCVFLGAGVQTFKKLLEDGAIGRVIGACAINMYHGPEALHPSPDFFYRRGAGPMLDIGPYVVADLLYFLGPVAEIFCYGGTKTSPRPIKDHFVEVEVNTHYNAVMLFADGNSASLDISWEIWGATNRPRVQVFGTEGSLFLHDSDNYGPTSGVQLIRQKDLEADGPITWEKLQRLDAYKKNVEYVYDSPRENRGLGLSEMADAIMAGRPHRASGEFACHLTEVLDGFNRSIASGEPYRLQTTFQVPDRLPVDFLERVK